MKSTYNVNTVYPAFQGEVNIKGIGVPVIFVRFQGCHLRCYKDTLGTLCDTPEALEGKTGGTMMDIDELMQKINNVSDAMGGVKLICLTGGDPLWRSTDSLTEFFYRTGDAGYKVSVETSGTLSIAPYRNFMHVSWVLDYKTSSAGVMRPFLISEINLLDNKDFIKFVLYDTADYAEFKEVLPTLDTKATIAVGVYWGGKMKTMELYNQLIADKLLGKVVLNVQLHKMAFYTDATHEQISEVHIPEKI